MAVPSRPFYLNTGILNWEDDVSENGQLRNVIFLSLFSSCRSNSGLFKVTCLQLFRMTRDLRCQKRLWIFGLFCDVNQNLKAPLKKKQLMVCDLWLVDFDPFCVFLCFKVRCIWTSKFGRLFLKSAVSVSLALSFLTFLHWNMTRLDSQGDIVSMEIPNPEEKQIWEGENEWVRSTNIYLCSFCSVLPPLFDKQGLDSIVTVWLTSKKTKTHDPETLLTTSFGCYPKQL